MIVPEESTATSKRAITSVRSEEAPQPRRQASAPGMSFNDSVVLSVAGSRHDIDSFAVTYAERPQGREGESQHTFICLDVHARSLRAALLHGDVCGRRHRVGLRANPDRVRLRRNPQ